MTSPRRSSASNLHLTRRAYALILLVLGAGLTTPYHNTTDPVPAPKPAPGPTDPVPRPPDPRPEPPLPGPTPPMPYPVPPP